MLGSLQWVLYHLCQSSTRHGVLHGHEQKPHTKVVLADGAGPARRTLMAVLEHLHSVAALLAPLGVSAAWKHGRHLRQAHA